MTPLTRVMCENVFRSHAERCLEWQYLPFEFMLGLGILGIMR